MRLVPRSKLTHCLSYKNQLVLYREVIAVCCEIHTKHINTLCWQNVEFYIIQAGDFIYIYIYINMCI